MTSGVYAGMLAPSSFCWPNLGCESPLAETPKASLCMGESEKTAFGCPGYQYVNRIFRRRGYALYAFLMQLSYFCTQWQDVIRPYSSLNLKPGIFNHHSVHTCRGVFWYHSPSSIPALARIIQLPTGFTPCLHLRPSSGRGHTVITYSVR